MFWLTKDYLFLIIHCYIILQQSVIWNTEKSVRHCKDICHASVAFFNNFLGTNIIIIVKVKIFHDIFYIKCAQEIYPFKVALQIKNLLYRIEPFKKLRYLFSSNAITYLEGNHQFELMESIRIHLLRKNDKKPM